MNASPHALAIDVGNSSIKLGEFRRSETGATGEPLRVFRVSSDTPDWDSLQAWLESGLESEPPEAFLISVCQPAADRLVRWMERHFASCLVRQLQLADFPLVVDVEFPERVGHDRLAAAVAANHLKTPDRAAVIIDAGSAITVDLVSPCGEFLGGAIFPGWKTMARSLAVGTHLLPHIDGSRFNSPPQVVGRSTEKAIASGLYWGLLGAVRELVDRISESSSPAPDQLLAGGDMQVLLPHLGDKIRCVPHMVLRGIIQSAASRTPNQ